MGRELGSGRLDGPRRAAIVGRAAAAAMAALASMVGLVSATVEAVEEDGDVTETFELGVFDLAAAGQPGSEASAFFVPVDRPDGDLAIRSVTWDLTVVGGGTGHDGSGHDGDGTASGVHLHHVVLLDTARRDLLCPSVGARFAATGAEMNELDLPDPYRYVSPEGGWQAVYHLMNTADVATSVRVSYEVTYRDAADGGFEEVEPYFFDVDGCWGDSEFDVPGDGAPGSTFEAARTWILERSGTIVRAGGHLHAGGIDLTLSAEGAGAVCVASAVPVGHGDHTVATTACGDLDVDVEAGDDVSLAARYRGDLAVEGAMGIMVTWVRHDGPPPAPAEVSIRRVSVAGDELVVEVTCTRPSSLEAWGSLTQRKGRTSIEAFASPRWGGAPPSCEPGAVAVVSLPLVGAGVLTGGTAAFDVSVYAFGREAAFDSASGTVSLRGRTQLSRWPAGEVDAGGVDVTATSIGRLDDGSLEVAITVPCDDPGAGGWVEVAVSQRVGRQVAEAYGSSAVRGCDDGRADVTALVPEPSRWEPVPGSPLTIDVTTQRRIVTVALAASGCEPGSTVWVDVVVQPLGAPGRRIGSDPVYGYVDEPSWCSADGTVSALVTVELPTTARRIGVVGWMSSWGPGGGWSATNAVVT